MVTSEPPVSSLMGINFFFFPYGMVWTLKVCPLGNEKKKLRIQMEAPGAGDTVQLVVQPADAHWGNSAQDFYPLDCTMHWQHFFTLHFCKQKCLRAGVHTSAYLYILTETKY